VDFNKLFNILDFDRDEKLSGKDLHRAAKNLGWYWSEAPFFAVFDLLTLFGSISRKTFCSYMDQIEKDPLGPYGDILLNARYGESANKAVFAKVTPLKREEKKMLSKTSLKILNDDPVKESIRILSEAGGIETAKSYERLLNELDFKKIHYENAAWLIIDPQRSFTKGAWMKSIGYGGKEDIRMIELSFKRCAKMLSINTGDIEIMFSRCPFPPDSYDWDEHFHGVIDKAQPYFIKPGNNIMFPPTNGFKSWVDWVINNGKTMLVMGGCTLNSCVRVSAVMTQKFFKRKNLQVIVDLSLSGARVGNYRRSAMFGGRSSVESAIVEMVENGVDVVAGIDYSD
jgi:hypothetical protein